MASWPFFVLAGAGIGLLIGVFGVGGSSIATPLLSIMGVAPLQAIASPLPATVPAALLAVVPYVRGRESRPRAAGWSILGGVPATVAGALLSQVTGGAALLLVSGVVLVVVGQRVLSPIESSALEAGTVRRRNRPLLVAAAAVAGLFTGLLANGGGFLLVPMYLLMFGLEMREAVGTSLLVVAALTVPTLLAHWALGHIDWTVAAAFAAGAVPAGALSGGLAQHVSGQSVRRAFGWLLIASGVAFVAFRLVAG